MGDGAVRWLWNSTIIIKKRKMKQILYKVPSLILIDLLKKPSTVKGLSRKFNSVPAHIYNILKSLKEENLIIKTKDLNKFNYSLSVKGKYIAQRIQEIYLCNIE